MLLFCFFLGGSEKFSLENFFREGDLGGVYTELLNFGGGLDGIGRKWGGSAFGARRAPNWYTPPPGMFMTPSLRLFFLLTLFSTASFLYFSKGEQAWGLTSAFIVKHTHKTGFFQSPQMFKKGSQKTQNVHNSQFSSQIGYFTISLLQ